MEDGFIVGSDEESEEGSEDFSVGEEEEEEVEDSAIESTRKKSKRQRTVNSAEEKIELSDIDNGSDVEILSHSFTSGKSQDEAIDIELDDEKDHGH